MDGFSASISGIREVQQELKEYLESFSGHSRMAKPTGEMKGWVPNELQQLIKEVEGIKQAMVLLYVNTISYLDRAAKEIEDRDARASALINGGK